MFKQNSLRGLIIISIFIYIPIANSSIYGTPTEIYNHSSNYAVLYKPINFEHLHNGLPGVGIVQMSYASPPNTYHLHLFSSTASGNFNMIESFSNLTEGFSYNLTGDLNGDGFSDLFTYTSNSIIKSITRFSVPGGLSDPYSFSPTQDAELWGICDMDGDSPPDLYGTSAGSVVIWKGLGSGQFDVIEVTGMVSANYSSSGDLDLDGDYDIVYATSSGELHVLLNEGELNFVEAGVYGPIFSNSEIVLSDLNGNGYLDIIVSHLFQYSTYMNNGFATFEDRFIFQPGKCNTYFDVEDLDMDGFPDLVMLSTSDEIDIYKGDGVGSFILEPTLFSEDYVLPSSLAIDDYDSDGDPDLCCVVSYGKAEFHFYCYWNNSYTQGCDDGTQSSHTPSLIPSTNPFRNGISITAFNCLPQAQIDILDLSGRLVSQISPIYDGLYYWDGTSFSGEQTPTGVYVMRIQGLSTNATVKLMKLD